MELRHLRARIFQVKLTSLMSIGDILVREEARTPPRVFHYQLISTKAGLLDDLGRKTHWNGRFRIRCVQVDREFGGERLRLRLYGPRAEILDSNWKFPERSRRFF